METITKNCTKCGDSFTVNYSLKFPNFHPNECGPCAMASDAKWREDNAEKREEMKRGMMAQWDELQKENAK